MAGRDCSSSRVASVLAYGGAVLIAVLLIRLYVAVDAATMHELEQRAASEGTDLSAAAANALRAGARAA